MFVADVEQRVRDARSTDPLGSGNTISAISKATNERYASMGAEHGQVALLIVDDQPAVRPCSLQPVRSLSGFAMPAFQVCGESLNFGLLLCGSRFLFCDSGF